MTTNRYLEGPLAPIHEEHTALDLEVTGTIPAELDGRYLRNGPNPIAAPDPSTHHWFTGDAMVHGIRLRDGRAEWYRNRWVRSTEVSRVLGEAPVPGDRYSGQESPNTNIIGLAGRTFAIVEAGGRPVELTDTLDTVCFSDLDGTLAHGYTAHPKVDPVTGDLHAVSYYWGRPDVVEYTVIGPDGHVRHATDVATPGNPMIHDCSLTESSVVVYDLPVTFDLDAAMAGAPFPYRWNAEHHARIGLLPVGGLGDQVEWFDVEPCYVFHPLNAYDDGDTVVLDVVRHPRMFATDLNGPNEGIPSLWRWTVDRSAGKVREEQLDDLAVEFPRVDERLVGRRHRYGLGTILAADDDGVTFDGSGLVRYDLDAGRSEVIDLGPGRNAGEAVFVPRSETAAEDDGWYLTLVWDRTTDRSELAILDASAPTEGPVARVHLPTRVPAGFHGNWVPTT
jgi:carotenoid cleavage dioxygenase